MDVPPGSVSVGLKNWHLFSLALGSVCPANFSNSDWIASSIQPDIALLHCSNCPGIESKSVMNPGGSNLCSFIGGFSRALLRGEFHQARIRVEPVLTWNTAIRHLLLIFGDQLEGGENQTEIRLEDLAVRILRDLCRKHGNSPLR